jgi:hypothetical protein
MGLHEAKAAGQSSVSGAQVKYLSRAAVVHLGLCSKRLWYESTFNCCHGVFMLKMRYMGMANYTRYSVITERKLQSCLPES